MTLATPNDNKNRIGDLTPCLPFGRRAPPLRRYWLPGIHS